MLIDWFTVGAQALNFLILLWLMKRFLYKPILNAIDARDKKISEELANANTKKNIAEKEKDEFKRKNEKFDKECAALLDKATAEANKRHTELMNEARKEMDDLRAKQKESLSNEQKSLSESIQQRVQDEIFSIVRKILHDLADVTLEERIIEVFIKQVREIKDEDKKVFANALSSQKYNPIMKSTFEIPQTQKTKLDSAMKEVFGVSPSIKYEISSTLVSGIEFGLDGQRISWSISNYLTSLDDNMNKVSKLPTEVSKMDSL